MQDRFLRERQIADMIYEYFRVTGAREAVLNFSDPFIISLHGDVIQDYDTRCYQAPLSTKEVPKGSILESLYKMRIRDSVQLQTVLATYEQEIFQDRSRP